MATVTRENIGDLHDKIMVKLAKEDYMPSFEQTLKQQAKTANVPGFRKGMVPAGMVRRMYGQTIFNEEVIRTASRRLEDYMRENRMSIFGQPLLAPHDGLRLDMNAPKDIDFTFEVGIKPQFEIPALRDKTPVTRYQIAVTDKMMDDELVRIMRRFGTVDPQEVVTDKENIIYCTYEHSDEASHITDTDKIEDTEVLDKMPAKLQELVMGKNAGDAILFRPQDVCTEEELKAFLKRPLKAGEEAAGSFYKLTITKIGHLIPAQMNHELYEKVFKNTEIKDEAQFREMVKAELEREFTRISYERLENELYELLVHTTPINLPVPFLKRWLMEGNKEPKTAEEVEQEFPGFEHQLRWQLISDKVIIENRLQVTRADIDRDIKGRVLSYFGMDMDEEESAPWLESYMGKITKDDKAMDETYRRLLTGRIFGYLISQLNIGVQEVSEEEFFKLPSPHSAYHHTHDHAHGGHTHELAQGQEHEHAH